jgi:hypothetical protein
MIAFQWQGRRQTQRLVLGRDQNRYQVVKSSEQAYMDAGKQCVVFCLSVKRKKETSSDVAPLVPDLMGTSLCAQFRLKSNASTPYIHERKPVSRLLVYRQPYTPFPTTPLEKSKEYEGEKVAVP